MAVEIVEILGRAHQGVTRPFICRGDDGNTYFVKGRGAGRRSQICELVAGQMAAAFGLPIAPFEIVVVPNELINTAFRDDLSELGAGPAFGSCRRNVTELSPAQAQEVAESLQRDVLAFDWWVQNGDRTLSERGGNPNLFWDIETDDLLVLDHNQAFDPHFTAEDFFSSHAFSGAARRLFSDWIARGEYQLRYTQILTSWAAYLAAIPPEWRFADDEQTVPTDFDSARALALLARFDREEFWSIP